jgi:hypothetical protein
MPVGSLHAKEGTKVGAVEVEVDLDQTLEKDVAGDHAVGEDVAGEDVVGEDAAGEGMDAAEIGADVVEAVLVRIRDRTKNAPAVEKGVASTDNSNPCRPSLYF